MAMLAGSRRLAATPLRPPTAARLLVPPVLATAAPKEAKQKVMKRAPSAFNLFYKQYYDEARRSLEARLGAKPGLPECNAALRDMWSKLSEAQKIPFEQQAAEAKEQLARDRAAGLVPKQERVRAPKDKSAAPRPPSAYALFTKSEFAGFKAQHPDLKVAEIQKLIAQKWRSLPEDQKNKLLDQARSAFASYKGTSGAPAAPAAPPAASKPPAAKAPSPTVGQGPRARTASPAAPPAGRNTPPAPGRAPTGPPPRVSPSAPARPSSAAPGRASPARPQSAAPSGRANTRSPGRR